MWRWCHCKSCQFLLAVRYLHHNLPPLFFSFCVFPSLLQYILESAGHSPRFLLLQSLNSRIAQEIHQSFAGLFRHHPSSYHNFSIVFQWRRYRLPPNFPFLRRSHSIGLPPWTLKGQREHHKSSLYFSGCLM